MSQEPTYNWPDNWAILGLPTIIWTIAFKKLNHLFWEFWAHFSVNTSRALPKWRSVHIKINWLESLFSWYTFCGRGRVNTHQRTVNSRAGPWRAPQHSPGQFSTPESSARLRRQPRITRSRRESAIRPGWHLRRGQAAERERDALQTQGWWAT